MTQSGAIDRRQFVKMAGGVAGGLVVGFSLSRTAGSNSAEPVTINAFVRIGPDDVVTIVNPAAEMGQGVHVALPQILAEELDVAWDRIRVVPAPVGAAYNNPGMPRPLQTTAGSTSVRFFFMPLRQAGAAAREVLVLEAARRWSVDPDECGTSDGWVVRSATGERFSYGELADGAAALALPVEPRLKSPGRFRYIGRSLSSPTTSRVADGSLQYTIDVRVPGMLYAAVTSSPVPGGKLERFHSNRAESAPGVRAIVPLRDGVAVVADRWWQAQQALGLLSLEFSSDGALAPETETIYAEIVAAAESEPGITFVERGGADRLLRESSTVHEGTYRLPYLANMSMEPLACVVRATDDGAEVWTGSQNIARSQATVARVFGVSEESVTVRSRFMGGSFGRRLGADLESGAAEIAKQVGNPVMLIWSREECTRHDRYRAVVAGHWRAALGPDGLPVALEVRIAQPPWPMIRPDGLDTFTMLGLLEVAYAIPNVRYGYVRHDVPIPIGQWRSVQHSYTIFFIESLVDELAAAAGTDPVEYRRRLLRDDPRALATIELAVAQSGWNDPPAPGRARGFGFCAGYGGYIAQVVEISVEDDRLTVHRVVNAVDCGLVVNPHISRGQIEGSMLQGLGAALQQEVHIADGAVVESNFHDYPHLTMADTPRIDVHFVDSAEAPGGVGELGTPAVQPALANAIFSATGRRIRSLPVTRHGFYY